MVSVSRSSGRSIILLPPLVLLFFLRIPSAGRHGCRMYLRAPSINSFWYESSTVTLTLSELKFWQICLENIINIKALFLSASSILTSFDSVFSFALQLSLSFYIAKYADRYIVYGRDSGGGDQGRQYLESNGLDLGGRQNWRYSWR